MASAEDAHQALESAEAALGVAFIDVQLVGSEGDDEGLKLVRAHAGRPGAPMFLLATAFGQHAVEACT